MKGSINCGDITDTDFNGKWQLFKFRIFKSHDCFKMSRDWAPVAVKTVEESLSVEREGGRA